MLEGRVPENALDRLERYATLLEKWGARHNLVHFQNRQELVERHILEALEYCRHMRREGRLLDVGSGGGLPGVPLLCARPGWSGVLLEPRQKRWAFLKTVVRELDLDARVATERFEQWQSGTVDLITVRAVGQHETLLGWARSHLERDGWVAIWATDSEEERLRTLSGWRVLSSPVLGLDRGRIIRFQVCST